MFTNPASFRFSRRAALIAVATLTPVVGFAGVNPAQTAFSVRTARQSVVRFVHPAPWPTGTDTSIRTDALRKKDDGNARHKTDGATIVRIDRGSPLPGDFNSTTRIDELGKKNKYNEISRDENDGFTVVRIDRGSSLPGDFDSTIRIDELGRKNKGNGNSRHENDGFTIVRIDRGSSLPGDFDSTIRLDELGRKNKGSGNSRRRNDGFTIVRIDHGSSLPGDMTSSTQIDGLSTVPNSSPFKNLELSSQARLSAAAPHIPVAAPINPPGRGRAWLSVTSDGSNGTEAGAGWTWTLR